MSTNENDIIYDEAAFYIDYFTNTTIGNVLQHDLDVDDLDSLHDHMKQARQEMFNLEYQP